MTGCALDGRTKDKLDTRSQHEYEPSGAPSAILWHAKDFLTAPEVAPEGWEMQPAAEDACFKINDDKTEFLVISSPQSKLSTDIKIKIGQSMNSFFIMQEPWGNVR